ncbi:squalene cyclase [Pseudonocardia sp. TRM90224]|uniref:squalene cyclase n=1 Tax=Pseudonocardia sp. TRM90224 TaxID=2812678 RepID=UPI0027E0E3FF|nr:squalene cyclase [Pseudonocardia sp. TRM90224]
MSDVLEWLLDSDPALRWQVQRDLAHLPEDVWRATRTRVATEGFGARLLAAQDPDGQWAGGAYFPAPAQRPDPEEAGQPYTATTWSLTTLREWGLDAAVLGDTAARLAASSRWEYDDLPYWDGEVDACINAMTLANGAWLGVDVSGIGRWLVEHRMADGGWNCNWVEGATVSSFHSTLNTVKGLRYHEAVTGGTDELRAARRGGEEYLLRRHLYRRLSTGEQVAPWASELVHPFRWVYSVLHAADHIRAASLLDGCAPDPRMAEAIGMIRAGRQPDGRWLQGGRHSGRVWFEVDVEPGAPSKWLTFFATRVLDRWDAP